MTKLFSAIVLSSIVLVSSAVSFSANAAPQKSLPPVDTSNMKSIGQLGPSFYWVAIEAKDGLPRDKDVKDMNGNVLYKMSQKNYKSLHLEGTGKLLNGKIINWAGKVKLPDGTEEYRYRWCGKNAPYGYGFEDRILIPFRTIAVDPSVVPLDSLVFIPAARGAVLPDGTLHDGYFHALDIGSAIINRRIDVFTAYGDQSAPFDKNGFKHGQAVEVYWVK